MKFSTILFLTLVFGVLSAQHQAILWRGFEFRWKNTNHRLNDFGSWACLTNDTVKVHNVAKSGSQSDRWLFQNHLTYLSGPHNDFIEKLDTISISGDVVTAPETHIRRRIVRIPYHGGNGAEVFINGFEILLDELNDAKKLISYNLSIDTVYVTSDEIIFEVSADISFKCTKLTEGLAKQVPIVRLFECNGTCFHYRIACRYLAITNILGNGYRNLFCDTSYWVGRGKVAFGGSPRRLFTGTGKAENFYGKDGPKPFSRSDLYYNPSLIKKMEYPAQSVPVTGIKQIRFSLDSENHLFFLSQFAGTCNSYGFMNDRNPSNCPECANQNVNGGLYFSPWRKNIAVTFRFFSFSKSGRSYLSLTTNTILLGSTDTQVFHFKTFNSAKYNVKHPLTGRATGSYLLSSLRSEQCKTTNHTGINPDRVHGVH